MRLKGDLHDRLLEFSGRIVRLYASLPKTTEAQVIGKQLLRSGTSVGAHAAEANRARSVAEFCSKVDGALQEIDETKYWLMLIRHLSIGSRRDCRFCLRRSKSLQRFL